MFGIRESEKEKQREREREREKKEGGKRGRESGIDGTLKQFFTVY